MQNNYNIFSQFNIRFDKLSDLNLSAYMIIKKYISFIIFIDIIIKILFYRKCELFTWDYFY